MYFISSIRGSRIGITDTADNVEEFYTNSQVVTFHEKKIMIYGASFWNHEATCTPLVLNQALNKMELLKRIKAWRECHNPWTEVPVRDYLACAKVGTKIIVEYSYVGDGDRRRHTATSKLERISIDEWLFTDIASGFNGQVGDSDFATGMLEISCIYGTVESLSIV